MTLPWCKSTALLLLSVLVTAGLTAQQRPPDVKALFAYPTISQLQPGEFLQLQNTLSNMRVFWKNFRGEDRLDASYKGQVFEYQGKIEDTLQFKLEEDVLLQGPLLDSLTRGWLRLAQVAQLNKALTNQQYYILSSHWRSARPAENLKYVPVHLDSLTADAAALPFTLHFTTPQGVAGSVRLGYSNDADLAAFQFGTWFSSQDPQVTLNQQQSRSWKLIQQGRVQPGMTPQEVTLSWGVPKETKRTENETGIQEEWQYDGKRTVTFRLKKEEGTTGQAKFLSTAITY